MTIARRGFEAATTVMSSSALPTRERIERQLVETNELRSGLVPAPLAQHRPAELPTDTIVQLMWSIDASSMHGVRVVLSHANQHDMQ